MAAIPPLHSCQLQFMHLKKTNQSFLLSKMSKVFKAEIGDINAANVQQLRVINISTLPVSYSKQVWKDTSCVCLCDLCHLFYITCCE